MRIYIIRHGESETNISQKWTGWLDVHLTDTGRAQAKNASELIKFVCFDKVYTSDLSRAMETAQIIVPGYTYETTPLLREINVGTLSNKPLSVMTDAQRARIPQDGYAEFDGETITQFHNRISQFKKELEALDCETVALFSHAGWLRGMLDMVVDAYLPRKHICCDNCAIAIFEYKNDVWKLHSWINPL